MPDSEIGALVEACIYRHKQPSEIESAVSAGADVNIASSSGDLPSPLKRAVKANRADIVSLLLRLNADPNLPDTTGGPLHIAIFDGMQNIAQCLIESRANVNMTDRYGQTPLFFAPHQEACAQLGNAKGDVNAMSLNGQSALHLAAYAGLNDVVMWLAERMARSTINAQDRNGRTAVYCAARSNFKSTIRLLHGHGADVSLQPPRYTAEQLEAQKRA